MLQPGAPAEKSLGKATIHQRKERHLKSESRTFQRRSATRVCCPAIHRIGTGPESSCRSYGCSCPLGWRTFVRNIRPASGCRPAALVGVAARWETHSADKTDPGERLHSQSLLSNHDWWQR